jgi:hypothetical protein
MNNRIQELAEQAGLHAYYEAQASQIQKFAELIIAECAKLCEPAAQIEQEPVAFAGIKIWLGNQQVFRCLTQAELHCVGEPWAHLLMNAEKCVEELRKKNHD